MTSAVLRIAFALFVVAMWASPVVSVGRPAVASPGATPTVREGEREGRFDVGGRSLYLRCSGAGGPTVIFESGSDVTTEAWLPIQEVLAPSTRSCAYDRANLGLSDPAPTPRSGADFVADLHRLLSTADVPGPYVLVGASLGGLFARLFAQTYPDEVVGMVLLDSAHEDLVPRLSALVGPAMLGPIRSALAGRDDREGFVVDGLIRDDLCAEVRATRAERPFPDMPLTVITPGTFQVLAVDALPGWPAAEADGVWLDLQQDLTTLSPVGTLVLAEGSGHFVQGDRPDLVLAAIHGATAPPATPPVGRGVSRRRS